MQLIMVLCRGCTSFGKRAGAARKFENLHAVAICATRIIGSNKQIVEQSGILNSMAFTRNSDKASPENASMAAAGRQPRSRSSQEQANKFDKVDRGTAIKPHGLSRPEIVDPTEAPDLPNGIDITIQGLGSDGPMEIAGFVKVGEEHQLFEAVEKDAQRSAISREPLGRNAKTVPISTHVDRLQAEKKAFEQMEALRLDAMTKKVLQSPAYTTKSSSVSNTGDEHNLKLSWDDAAPPARALQCEAGQQSIALAEQSSPKTIKKAWREFAKVIEAERRALEALQDAHGNLPLKWEDSPKKMKMPEFVEKYYYEPGLIQKGVTRSTVAIYDEEFITALTNYESRVEKLEPHLQIKKDGRGRKSTSAKATRSKTQPESHP